MMTDSLFPVLLSLKCGLLSALLTMPWGIFWGWILARRTFPGRGMVETVLNIPLVLPPVLTGYFLIVIFSRNGWLGGWLDRALGIRFFLDWKGAVLAAAVVASPFMIQMAKEAFLRIDERLEMAAANLGAGPFRRFRTILLPLAWPGLMAGFFLAFARSLGEFGATIMLAGNIPHKTQTIPSAIYSHVMLGQDTQLVPLVICALVMAYGGLALSRAAGQKGVAGGRAAKGRDV